MNSFVIEDQECEVTVNNRKFRLYELSASAYNVFCDLLVTWVKAVQDLENGLFSADDNTKMALRKQLSEASVAVVKHVLTEATDNQPLPDEAWCRALNTRKLRVLIDKQNELNSVNAKKN